MKNPQPPAPRPVPELAQLEAGLEALARAGRVAQCVAQDAWISDDAEDRAAAAEGCTWCPLTAPCLAAGLAVRSTWAIWGGHDLGDIETRPAAHRAARAGEAE